jgi:hypothetical protein
MPLLYEFCEFFGIQYTIGIGTNSRLQGPAQRLQRRLARRYRRTAEPQRSFSSFRYRAHSWSHQRRITYKAEHTAAGTNLRFLVTNLAGRSRSIFSFYSITVGLDRKFALPLGVRHYPSRFPMAQSRDFGTSIRLRQRAIPLRTRTI